jgi:hypothetical protein
LQARQLLRSFYEVAKKQGDGVKHIALPASVRARVVQRTIRHKGTSRFRKVDEERQLPKRREGGLNGS